jgi:nicotinamide-nucleotide amidase
MRHQSEPPTNPPGGGAAAIIAALVTAGQTLAVAESLTGGLLSAALVDVAGASAAFRGGIVAYATDLKGSLLAVPAPLLAERGAVDADVASAMARGVAAATRSDWGLATTGVAGPDPQDGHPPGTVFVALTGPNVDRVASLRLTGGRPAIRAATVTASLGLLATALGLPDSRP